MLACGRGGVGAGCCDSLRADVGVGRVVCECVGVVMSCVYACSSCITSISCVGVLGVCVLLLVC